MDDLLEIESSSSLDQNNDLLSIERHDTQEILYDEKVYDDNNAWESFIEPKPAPTHFEPDIIADQQSQALKANHDVSKNPVGISPVSSSRKNEIRDLLMDLF